MPREKIDLLQAPVKTCFHQYLLPAIMGLVIKSLFIMGDTLIIGRGLGADGLGAIALAIPFFALFTAIAMMIGIGGAAVMAVQFGRGQYEEGQALLSQSLLLTLLLATGLSVLAWIGLHDLLAFLGATGGVAEQAEHYLRMMLKFFPVYSLCWVLSCFIRNDSNPGLAMGAMAIAAITNLGLDSLFIFGFGWGIESAAVATGIAQLLLFGLLSLHFFSGRGHLKLSLKGIGLRKLSKTLPIGLPTFFIESTLAVTGLMFNYVLLRQGGELYVSAYSIMINVGVLVTFILIGIGQAAQPIISFNYGAGASGRIRQTLLISLRYALITALTALGVMMVVSHEVASWFAVDNPELAELSAQALRYFFVALPFIAVNLLTATAFQAMQQPFIGTLISILRGFVLVMIGLVFLPKWLPESGVWLCILFAECLAAGISVVQLKRLLAETRQGFILETV